MSKQPNTTLIGAFVVGAVLLVVAALMIFGGGKFLTEKGKFVLFFEGSVKGLNIGAPVDFKGVRVGSVTNIRLLYDPRDLSAKIPVFIEIEARRMESVIPEVNDDKKKGHGEGLGPLVEKGLRAQLASQSFVTGQLYVDLDFRPEKPPRFSNLNLGVPEIPTIPSTFEEIAKTIETIPINELAQKVQSAMDGIDRLVNSPDLHASTVALRETLEEAKVLMKNSNKQIEQVAAETKKLVSSLEKQVVPVTSEFRETMKETRLMVQNFSKNIGPIASSLVATLNVAQASLKQAENTIGSVDGLIGEKSGLKFVLNDTMEELSSAARSIREMTDYLERHPESLIRGKKSEGKK
ncbi:MAG: MlaD family protein [Syntrophobacter sp.]